MKLLEEWNFKIDEESLHTDRMDSSIEEAHKIVDESRFEELHGRHENNLNFSKA